MFRSSADQDFPCGNDSARCVYHLPTLGLEVVLGLVFANVEVMRRTESGHDLANHLLRKWSQRTLELNTGVSGVCAGCVLCACFGVHLGVALLCDC